MAKKITLWGIKGCSGLITAYILAIIGQEFIRYGLFSFLFILLSVTGAFLYLVKDLKFLGIFLVDLCLISTAFLLRFYVIFSESG